MKRPPKRPPVERFPWRNSRFGGASKISPVMIDALCQALYLSGDEEIAARTSAINPVTFWRWKKRGNEVLARCIDPDGDYDLSRVEQPERVYAVFVLSIECARALRFQDLKEGIRGHGEKDWRALAWLLEKEDPGKFGPRVAMESRTVLRIEEDRRIEVRLESLNDDELRSLSAILGKIEPTTRAESVGTSEPSGLRALHDAGISSELASSASGGEIGTIAEGADQSVDCIDAAASREKPIDLPSLSSLRPRSES